MLQGAKGSKRNGTVVISVYLHLRSGRQPNRQNQHHHRSQNRIHVEPRQSTFCSHVQNVHKRGDKIGAVSVRCSWTPHREKRGRHRRRHNGPQRILHLRRSRFACRCRRFDPHRRTQQSPQASWLDRSNDPQLHRFRCRRLTISYIYRPTSTVRLLRAIREFRTFAAGIRMWMSNGDFFESTPACILPGFRGLFAPGFIRRQSSF